MMSSQFSDPPSPLPFQRLLFCTWGENWVYAMPFIAFVLRKFSCRNCFSWIGNRVGSRKMTAQCEERHIQLPQEQKLYSLMLFLCWSEPFRTFNSDWIYCLFHLTTHGCVVLASGEAWIRTRSAGQHLSLGQGPLGLAAALCWLQSTASTLSLTNSAPLAQKMRREAAWGTEAVALSLARDLSDYALWMG